MSLQDKIKATGPKKAKASAIVLSIWSDVVRTYEILLDHLRWASGPWGRFHIRRS